MVGHLRHVITAAQAMEVPYVNTFMGGDGAKDQDANWQEALRVWPDIVAFAADPGARSRIENCPMLFSLDEWPGGHNIATNAADLAPDPRAMGRGRSASTSTRRTWSCR